MGITNIANRLTPSNPTEIVFGAQPVATGRKFATLFGHKASSGGTGPSYHVHEVVNVADPVAALAEVDALAGIGSEIGTMVVAFIKANIISGNSNFPAFRIVLIPNAVTDFGPSDEALEAVKNLRSDLLVSCYKASSSTNRQTLIDFANLISGPDRNLSGQFGSSCVFGSKDAFVGTADSYNIDEVVALVAYMQDQGLVTTGNTTNGSPNLTSVANSSGVRAGQSVTGTGIPANTVVSSVEDGIIVLSANATATGTGVALTIKNDFQTEAMLAAAHAASMLQLPFPYVTLKRRIVGGLVGPVNPADRIVVDPNGLSEQALAAGLSPMIVDSSGRVRLLRTRLTRVTTNGVTPATAYIDWQDVVTLYDFREDCFSLETQPQFDNSKASQQKANLLKDEMLKLAKQYEDEGAFQDVKKLSKYFQVLIPTDVRGRFDWRIPVDVIPGLQVIAGQIVATTSNDFVSVSA